MGAHYWGRFRFLGKSIILIPFCIYGLYLSIYNGDIPGLNVINITVFFLAAFLFIPSLLQTDRTMALTDLLRHGTSDLYILSRKFEGNRSGSNYTWAGTNTKSYRIEFGGTEQGLKNGEEVIKTMKSTPRIIWIRPGTWSVIYVAIFLLNFFFYVNVMPFFKNLDTHSTEYIVIEYIIFYLPSLLALICPVLSIIFVKVRDNILYECAVRLSNEILADLNTKNIPGKWYHNVCPECGTKCSSSIKTCTSCGSPLEVKEECSNLYSARYMDD